MDGQTSAQHPPAGQPRESERTRRLRSLGLDSPTPDEAFDRFAHLAASITKAPFAMVNFINDERQMFRGLFVPPAASREDGDGSTWADRGVSFELPTREMPMSHGFCPHVLAQRSPLALDDVFAYPRFSGNPVVNELGVRSYLGAPLVDDEGTVIGTVCVLDQEPRSWGREQLQDMQRLAESLLSEIRLRDSLLRQQQEMLAAFEGSPFPIMLTEGPDHRVRYANAEHQAVFGLAASQADGPRSLPQLAAVGVFDAVAEAFASGHPYVVEDVRVRARPGHDAEGSDPVFTFSCTPLHMAYTGEVHGVLVVGVTGQTRTDEDLDRLAALLVARLQRDGGSLAVPPLGEPSP